MTDRVPAEPEVDLLSDDKSLDDLQMEEAARRMLIQTQLLQMGFDMNRILMLLFINPAWADITSTDIAIDVMHDPLQHKFIQKSAQDQTCSICGNGIEAHRPGEVYTQKSLLTG